MESDDLNWRKASKSGNGGAECVEVAAATGFTGIRDSKSPERGHLAVTPEVFAVLLADAKHGRFDLGRLEREEPRNLVSGSGVLCQESIPAAVSAVTRFCR